MTAYNKDKIVTFKDYVYNLCKFKGISIKKLSEDLGSLKSHINKSIGVDRRIQIIKYLDGDLTLGLTLPFTDDEHKRKD